MVLREVFQLLEWCVRQCVGSIPPQPQVENESQELPFLSQLLSSNRIRSQCQQKQLQATQTNLLFFSSPKVPLKSALTQGCWQISLCWKTLCNWTVRGMRKPVNWIEFQPTDSLSSIMLEEFSIHEKYCIFLWFRSQIQFSWPCPNTGTHWSYTVKDT